MLLLLLLLVVFLFSSPQNRHLEQDSYAIEKCALQTLAPQPHETVATALPHSAHKCLYASG